MDMRNSDSHTKSTLQAEMTFSPTCSANDFGFCKWCGRKIERKTYIKGRSNKRNSGREWDRVVRSVNKFVGQGYSL